MNSPRETEWKATLGARRSGDSRQTGHRTPDASPDVVENVYKYNYKEDSTFNPSPSSGSGGAFGAPIEPMADKSGDYTKSQSRTIKTDTLADQKRILQTGDPRYGFGPRFVPYTPSAQTSRVGDAFTQTGKHEHGAGTSITTANGVTGPPSPYSLFPGEDLFPPPLEEVAPPLTEVLGIVGDSPPLESFFDVSNLPRVIGEVAAVDPGPADPNDEGTVTTVLPDWAASIIKGLDAVMPDWARSVIEGLSQPDVSDFVLPMSGTVIKTGGKGISVAAKAVKTTGSANAVKLGTPKAIEVCPAPGSIVGKLTGVIERHHQLPKEFAERFKKAGLDIEDYVIPLDKATHRLNPGGLHTNSGGNWNRVWGEFFDEFPNASNKQILDKLAQMRKQFGLE